MNQRETLVCLLETYARIRPGLVHLHRQIAIECPNFKWIHETEWLIDEIDRCFRSIHCPDVEQTLYEIRQKIAAED